MVAVFTTIGMSASLRLLKVGGAQGVIFFGLATFGTVSQNLLRMTVTKVFGARSATRIITGSVTMAGGPATALAFGADFERRLVPRARCHSASPRRCLTVVCREASYPDMWAVD